MSNSAINTQVAQLKIGNVQNQADNSAVYSGGIWSLKNSTALTSVTITDSGNVGIGTASPSTKLHVLSASDDIARFSATAPYLSFFNGATRIGYIRCTSGGALLLNAESANSTMTFYTGDNERMRIDASGNVGIGTSSPAAKLDVTDAGGSVRIGNLAIESPSASGLTFNASNGVGNLLFRAAGAERMRIDASGNLLVGRTSTLVGEKFLFWGGQTRVGTSGSNDNSLSFAVTSSGNSDPFQVYTSANGSPNASASCVVVRNNGTTTRSINASGTINASGADYAEYMTKAGDFTIAKGNICGINAEGKLTKTFSEAVTFVVKSTNPSYVGGDSWGSNFEVDSEELEAARQLVDRIAFCGQVPVNVLGATPGQWIIPVEDNGGIKGEAVSSPSFEQYQKAVGKVIAVEEDGRARIIVKIA